MQGKLATEVPIFYRTSNESISHNVNESDLRVAAFPAPAIHAR